VTATPGKGALVSGLGISRIGRRLGVPGADLTVEAARRAIEDAGLVPAQIDGIATLGDTPAEEAATLLGISATSTVGRFDSTGLLAPFAAACVAVTEGAARHVLVYRTVQMLGGTIPPSAARPAKATATATESAMASVMGDMGPLLAHHAYSAANWIGMHAQRHMHRYGTTREQLGWVALNGRRHAATNPLAAYRDPMTMADYLAARWVSTPFGLLDCDVPIDGSIAVVVSSPDHEPDLAQAAVRVEALGGGTGGSGGWTARPDYPRMASYEAAAEMWSRTDLRPSDVNVAELYDGFTFLTLAWLEALGFCSEGESGPFVDGGVRTALDGELPLNTYGGQLSAGRMHGYWLLHEACLQLRGSAPERRVPGAEVAVAAAGGGPIAGCVLLTT
jgi:acetyl-CoA acetyltransferase